MAEKKTIEALKMCMADMRTICRANDIPFFCVVAPLENPEAVAASWYITKTTNTMIKGMVSTYKSTVVISLEKIAP